MPGVMAHACNPSTSEAEVEELPQILDPSPPCHTPKKLNKLNCELNMKQMMDKFLVPKSNPLSTKLRGSPIKKSYLWSQQDGSAGSSNPWERTNSHRLLWPLLNETMHYPNIKLSFKLKRNSSTQEAEARGLRLARDTRWDSLKSLPDLVLSSFRFHIFTLVFTPTLTWSRAGWRTLAFGRWKQKNREFKTSLCYTRSCHTHTLGVWRGGVRQRQSVGCHIKNITLHSSGGICL